jgi:hypothetical protein
VVIALSLASLWLAGAGLTVCWFWRRMGLIVHLHILERDMEPQTRVVTWIVTLITGLSWPVMLALLVGLWVQQARCRTPRCAPGAGPDEGGAP